MLLRLNKKGNKKKSEWLLINLKGRNSLINQ